ncbi:MAG TPA: dienelactone hydrolase family protein [Streptosporangiaceae bacterium]|nr:dienelactone hydrolase family protein [Streptosporangiaceae bacterium]
MEMMVAVAGGTVWAEDTAGDGVPVSYPGAWHAFFWPGTPPFSREARDDAWRRVVGLLAS